MTTTCQICGRNIKANTGRVAHHGYRRPYEGMQTSSCYGARALPYEKSCDLIGAYILILENVLSKRLAEIARLAGDAGATFMIKDRRASARTGRPIMVEMGPAEPLYHVRKKERIGGLNSDARALEREIAEHQRRIREWKLVA